MAAENSDVLDEEQRRALLVLGSLFLRMGQYARARKLFSALLALKADDSWARRGLAATCAALGDGEAALKHIDQVLAMGSLPSRDAALYLVKARALWLCGRQDEARNAVHIWLDAGGSRS